MAVAAYLGIDPSLRSSGICLYHENKTETWRIAPPRDNGKNIAYDLLKIYHSYQEIKRFLERRKIFVSVVAIESNFYGPNHLSARMLNAAWAVANLFVAELGIQDIMAVHPGTLKKFATQSAQADKSRVAMYVAKDWKFEDPCNDVVDAFVLAQMARCYDMPSLYSQERQVIIQQYVGLQDAAQGADD